MGISGLLQFIKDAAEPTNVKKYKGQTVAVDTYCWLHKGAFSCAEKLAKGEPTDQYVWYCMKFVDMLLNFSVKPILVFDGRNLPSKREVEKTRKEFSVQSNILSNHKTAYLNYLGSFFQFIDHFALLMCLPGAGKPIFKKVDSCCVKANCQRRETVLDVVLISPLPWLITLLRCGYCLAVANSIFNMKCIY
ncbi:hypothetical protein XENOCAPTIV_000423 [Xenoophorus captivus]|uniref:Exonuclease 1 n=1 Tax=Xenoophorus captivus TaxID=1517983 RepID=A0ABV0QP14_9TELE